MTKFYIVVLTILLTKSINAQTTRTASDYTQLVTAINNSAATGDVISITNNIVVTAEVAIAKSVTINGNGHLITVVNPGLNDMGQLTTGTTSDYRVFNISGATNTVINNCTIKGGFVTAAHGGAIYIATAATTLRLNNVTLSHSRSGQISGGARSGGAIYINEGQLYMNSCNVLFNAATFGGAISNYKGKVFINNSSITQNRAISNGGGGGAISNWSGKMYLNNTTISNNQGTEVGGAITNFQIDADLYLVNCSLTGNVTYGSSSFKGGAIGNNTTTGSVYAINTLFAHNYHILSGSVTSPASYELDDFVAYQGQNKINLYYCMYHAPLPATTQNQIGNIAYTGLQNGSNNSLFAGGSLAKVSDNMGTEVGTGMLYRPFLYNGFGSPLPILKTNATLLATNKRGTKTRYNDANGTAVVAYYNKTSATWVNLTGTSTSNQQITSDQAGTTRLSDPAIGAVETTSAPLYMVKVKAGNNGTVTGATVYGEVYNAGEGVTLTALANAGYLFDKWTFAEGGNGTTPATNPYTFNVSGNVTVVPSFNAAADGQYSVTYVGNGNEKGTAPATVKATGQVQLSAKGSMSKSGYAFTGWNTNANGNGNNYVAQSNYTAGANIVLYAQWKRNYWTGATNTAGNTQSNWEATVLPDAGDDWVFAADSKNDIVLSDNKTAGTIYFNGSAKKVVLGNYNITMAATNGENANSYIKTSGQGKVIVPVPANDSSRVAVGHTSFNPVTIVNRNSTADNFMVAVLDEVYVNGTGGAMMPNARVKRTWNITKANASNVSGIDLVLNWNSGEAVNVTNPALYTFKTNEWQKQGGTTTYTATTLRYRGFTGTPGAFAVLQDVGTLPVTWLGLTAQKQGKKAFLKWQVTNEVGVKKYELQHSANNRQWASIAELLPGNALTPIKTYQYEDANLMKGNNYYRVVQWDVSGQQNISKVVSLVFDESLPLIKVFPNPAPNGKATLVLQQQTRVSLYNTIGVLVYSRTLPQGTQAVDFGILGKGTYWLFTGNNETPVALQVQ